MAIILRLDRVMANRKMSLNELAEKVGISNVNISKIKILFATWISEAKFIMGKDI